MVNLKIIDKIENYPFNGKEGGVIKLYQNFERKNNIDWNTEKKENMGYELFFVPYGFVFKQHNNIFIDVRGYEYEHRETKIHGNVEGYTMEHDHGAVWKEDLKDGKIKNDGNNLTDKEWFLKETDHKEVKLQTCEYTSLPFLMAPSLNAPKTKEFKVFFFPVRKWYD